MSRDRRNHTPLFSLWVLFLYLFWCGESLGMTVTESFTNPLTEPPAAPTHQLLTTNPPWMVSLTITLTLDRVVGSCLDVDDYVIMLHIPCPPKSSQFTTPTHWPLPTGLLHCVWLVAQSVGLWISGTFSDTTRN